MTRRPRLALLIGAAVASSIVAQPAAAGVPRAVLSAAPPSEAETGPESTQRTDAQDAATSAESARELTPGERRSAAHVVLPCGLRVVVAKDASLPVASVVLALEVGTRDDPESEPGLTHALAYQLQQGNRELRPGEAAVSATDVGGMSMMAVGHAQTRFESLVPVSQLDRMLEIEASRLRAPNVNETLWLKSLSYAQSDRRKAPPVPPAVLAAAWGEPSLGHRGHLAPRELSKLPPGTVKKELLRRFEYRHATLVVVSPRSPDAVVDAITKLFASLPEAKRERTRLQPPAASPTTVRKVEVRGQRGNTLVWSVPALPSSRAWAQVVCATINRQRRLPEDPSRSRLRCSFVDDPRRPVMALRASGVDEPTVLAISRLARIQRGDETRLVSAQIKRIERRIGQGLHTPLSLARALAATDPGQSGSTVEQSPIMDLSGLGSLGEERGFKQHVPSLFVIESSILLLPKPKRDAKSTKASPETKIETKSETETKAGSDPKPEAPSPAAKTADKAADKGSEK